MSLLRGRGQMMAAMGMRRRSSSLTSVLEVSARVGGRDEPGCLMMRGVVVVSLLAKASMRTAITSAEAQASGSSTSSSMSFLARRVARWWRGFGSFMAETSLLMLLVSGAPYPMALSSSMLEEPPLLVGSHLPPRRWGGGTSPMPGACCCCSRC